MAAEMPVLLANHWLNSQLASEAASVSSVMMSTAMAMKDADPSAAASLRVGAPAVNSATRRVAEYRWAKKGFFNGARVLHNSRNDLA